jgi:steroid 5-alpha reductase family enzyme
MAAILGVNAAVVALLFGGLWLASLRLRNASIVDPFWGAGFVLVAWSTWWLADRPSGLPLLLAVLTTVWGLRLSLFLAWRNWGHGEDRRYRAMRDHHGARFWWVSLVTVFSLQAAILWFIALPLQFGIGGNAVLAASAGDNLEVADRSGSSVVADRDVASNWPTGPGRIIAVSGVALWLLGIVFESLADWQLARFQSNPAHRGRVLDTGLWRYSRHPNYFGDACVWWGLYLIAASLDAWATILSPLAMTLLLLKVSGVSLLESTIVERRPEYVDYIRRTNAFIPGPRRRDPNR